MAIMITLALIQLGALVLAMNALSAARALIGGEGFWSKAQKTASLNLTQYAATNKPYYYREFKKNIKVPLADMMARLELEKDDYDKDLVKKLLTEGKNHPDDMDNIIFYIRSFQQTKYFKAVLHEWIEGDKAFNQLINYGVKIHREMMINGPYKDDDLDKVLKDLTILDIELGLKEDRFSTTLGFASRDLERALLKTLVILVIVTFLLAFFIVRSLRDTYNISINAIKRSVNEAMNGNFDELLTISKADDIGELSSHLNRMFMSLKEQTLGRLSAEMSEARLSLMADAMPQIVVVRNKQGSIEYINQRAWDFLGHDIDLNNVDDLIKIIHAEDFEYAEKIFRESLRTKNPFEFEMRILNKDNEYIWFLTRFIPVKDAQGDVEKWYGSLTDIEEQKNINLELEKAVITRDEFLSIASHELKTPLTAFKLQLQLRKRYLERGDTEKFTNERIEKMLSDDGRHVNKLIHLVDDMLDISRIRKGKMELELQDFNFQELLDEVIGRFSLELNSRNCKVLIQNKTEMTVYGDRFKLEQVLINLITNAIKYGKGSDIEISCFKNETHYGFCVKDNGIGISEENKEKVFELFERIKTPFAVGGLGLGLYIVRQIITAHNGTIHVNGEVDNGSVFTVEIPLNCESALA